jgi:2,3-bisphosphoglycerate-dependent phosphoglycerate mutase
MEFGFPSGQDRLEARLDQKLTYAGAAEPRVHSSEVRAYADVPASDHVPNRLWVGSAGELKKDPSFAPTEAVRWLWMAADVLSPPCGSSGMCSPDPLESELNDGSVIYLARHGETDWNRERRWQGQTDTRLNADGRGQAKVLAEAVASLGITRIHASDLLRARETAEIVALHLGIATVVTDRDLRERNFGVFEGLTFAECAEAFPEMWARYRADRTRPEGAEPDSTLAGRVTRGIERALEGPGIALVVSHGGAMRMYLQSQGKGVAKESDFAFANGALLRLRYELRSGVWCMAGTERIV